MNDNIITIFVLLSYWYYLLWVYELINKELTIKQLFFLPILLFYNIKYVFKIEILFLNKVLFSKKVSKETFT